MTSHICDGKQGLVRLTTQSFTRQFAFTHSNLIVAAASRNAIRRSFVSTAACRSRRALVRVELLLIGVFVYRRLNVTGKDRPVPSTDQLCERRGYGESELGVMPPNLQGVVSHLVIMVMVRRQRQG